MSPPDSDDDTKRTDQRPEPLCLFYFPPPTQDEDGTAPSRTYVCKPTPRWSKRKSPESARRAKLEELKGGTDTSTEGRKPGQVKGGVFKRGGRRTDEWSRRRTGGRIGKRKDPAPSFKSYLLASGHTDQCPPVPSLQQVLETLEDAWPPHHNHKEFLPDRNHNDRDTSESNGNRSRTLDRQQPERVKCLQFAQPLMNRRFSMPEEVMRKYSVTKERTSEESEENKTMPEITSPSSKEDQQEKTPAVSVQPQQQRPPKTEPRVTLAKSKREALKSEVFSKRVNDDEIKLTRNVMTGTKGPNMKYLKPEVDKSFYVLSDSVSPQSTSTEPVKRSERNMEDDEDDLLNIIDGTSGSDSESDASQELPDLSTAPRGCLRETRTMKRAPLRRGSVFDVPEQDDEQKRVSQNQYYNQGKGIIHLKAKEKGCQTGDNKPSSSSSVSAQEESEEGETSESISSPIPYAREDDYSDNLSSDSENISCTCAEISSSKSSSDRFHSGKSTLSQSVSDKTVSTQDSTISINSVSTRGSTISADSNSTSPEVDPRTIAKETTTSPDQTPRTPHTPRDRGRPFTRGGRRSFRSNQKHDKTCPKYQTRGQGGGTRYGPKDQEQVPPNDQENTVSHYKENIASKYKNSQFQEKQAFKYKEEVTFQDEEEIAPKYQEKIAPLHQEEIAVTNQDEQKLNPRFLAEDLYNIPNRNVKLNNLKKQSEEREESWKESGTNNGNGHDVKPDKNYGGERQKDKRRHKSKKKIKTPDTEQKKSKKGKKQEQERHEWHEQVVNEVVESKSKLTKSPKETKQAFKVKSESSPKAKESARFLMEDLYNLPDKNTPPDPDTCRHHCSKEMICSTPIANSGQLPPMEGTPDEAYSSNYTNGHDAAKAEVTPSEVKEQYQWAKLSQEEMYMMQQQRHRKFIENQRRLSVPLQQTPDTGTLASCVGTGIYTEPAVMDTEVMVARFSALPRTMSMLVNTSANTSLYNSDSDNHSLADSLEDHPSTRMHRLYFDTKPESKPVRGDSTAVPRKENKLNDVRDKGKAFFVSITQQGSEDAVLTDISKIPEPPEKIKNQIFERHLKMCKKTQKVLSHSETQTETKRRKIKKATSRSGIKRKEDKTSPGRKTEGADTSNKDETDDKATARRSKRTTKEKEKGKSTESAPEKAKKSAAVETRNKIEVSPKKLSSLGSNRKSKFQSKIPVPVSEVGRSTSSSPERDTQESTKRSQKKTILQRTKKREQRTEETPAKLVEIQKPVDSTTKGVVSDDTGVKASISEKERTTTMLSPVVVVKEQSSDAIVPPKPQAVIHPSQPPAADPRDLTQRRLSLISSLESSATILKLQQVGLQVPQHRPISKPVSQPRRQSVPKFQQKFEVIPEERSSSLTSSAEDRWSTEKNRRRSLPVKLTEIQTGAGGQVAGPADTEFRRYSLGSISNVIIAKLMGRPLQAIPCIQRGPNNKDQQIIVLSPKDGLEGNSSKGRDALLAMNRVDFNRLSQGWMNFYILNPETSDHSPEEDGESNKRQDKQYTLTNFKVRKEEEVCQSGKQRTIDKAYIIENIGDVGVQENKPKQPPFGLNNVPEENEEELQDENQCPPDTRKTTQGRKKTLKRADAQRAEEAVILDREPNTIVCRIPSMERDASQSTSGGSGSLEDETTTQCAPGSGHCNPNPQSYSMFLTPNSQPDAPGEEQMSEFVLVEKPDDPELMCLNGIEQETARQEEVPTESTILPQLVQSKEEEACLCQNTTTAEGKKESRSKASKKCKRKTEVSPAKEAKEAKRLDENVRLNCSSTILQTTKSIHITPRSTPKRHSSLPELVPSASSKSTPSHKTKSSVEALPQVCNKPSDQEDSDSTVYFQPPSPRVPPIALEGSREFLTDDTFSSTSESENEATTTTAPPLPVRYLPLRKRGASNRTRLKHHESPRAKTRSGKWTVTVAGMVELSRSTPDVQMRLSFPASTRPHVASQSDSGFADDPNSSQNLDEKLARKPGFLPPANLRQRWTVTVKNPSQGSQESNKQLKKSYSFLPDVGKQILTAKKGLKVNKITTEQQHTVIQEKLMELWPAVEDILERELDAFNRREVHKVTEEPEVLSVQGSAVHLETKPRVPTMSERDLTRSSTSRSNLTARQQNIDINLLPSLRSEPSRDTTPSNPRQTVLQTS